MPLLTDTELNKRQARLVDERHGFLLYVFERSLKYEWNKYYLKSKSTNKQYRTFWLKWSRIENRFAGCTDLQHLRDQEPAHILNWVRGIASGETPSEVSVLRVVVSDGS